MEVRKARAAAAAIEYLPEKGVGKEMIHTICVESGVRRRCRQVLTILALVVSIAPFLMAQYPGQYPPGQYPPGQYPPGQYPQGQGGIGIPVPHIGKKKSSSDSSSSQNDPNAFKAEGTVKSIDDKQMIVLTTDSRTLTLKLDDKTKYVKAQTDDTQDSTSSKPSSGSTSSGSDQKPAMKRAIDKSAIEVGSLVTIQGTQDADGNMIAKVVGLKNAPSPTMSNPSGEQSGANEDRSSNSPMMTHAPPEASSRPHLTRGAKPGQPEEPDDTPVAGEGVTFEKDPNPEARNRPPGSGNDEMRAAPVDPKLVPVEKAREWMNSMSATLPNFVCNQQTTRYQMESKSTGWRALDIVSAEVVYMDGKEDYRKIAINGKPTNKGMMEIGGSTSTGEYGTTLRELFYEGTYAHFKYNGPARAAGKEAIVFDYVVDKMNSGWQILQGGQSITPGFSGSVWIDKSNGHVLRIEQQADNIPKSFPLDHVEMEVEYDVVHLAADQAFILPVHSENLGCLRGTPNCMKNTIDFRNYHKFGSESTIVFK